MLLAFPFAGFCQAPALKWVYGFGGSRDSKPTGIVTDKSAKVLKCYFSLTVKVFLFWIILFLPCLVSAQTDNRFWFAAPNINNEGRNFDQPILLRLTTATSAATVTISIPSNPAFTPITSNISANSTASIDLTPWLTLLENTPANTVLNRGLLISSTADITAYYENLSQYDPEIYALKGKNALGTEFFISSQYTYDESTAYQSTNSFDIVATVDNTHVTITPKQNIIGHNANIPFTIVLNKGQTYSAVAVSILAAGHLQGSYITSDNAIAVTLKDDLVQVSSCADQIGDQTVPTSVLGNEYIVTKGFLQTNDNIYVLAIANNTSVYVDGNTIPTAVLAKGQSTLLSLSNPSTYIRSDNNIYVYHLTGNGCEVGSAIIPKLNCTGSKSVSIVRSNSDLFAVMITTKRGNENNFTVNGSSTIVRATDFSPVPGTGGAYLTSRIDLSNTVSVGSALNFSNSTGKFSLGLINGGTNDGTSYGFFSDFKSSNVQNSSTEICQSDSAQLQAYGGVTYKWSPAAGLSNTNIANPKASPSSTTDYMVIITTADGCVDSAKVHVKVYSVQKVNTTATICSGGSYTLPSGKIANTAGTYNDTIKYKSGCDSLVTTLNLTVVNPPVNTITAPAITSFCANGDPSVIIGGIPTGGTGTYAYQWQNSIDNINFTNIAGATAKDYDPPVLSANTYYRRTVTSGVCNIPVLSNVITITVLPSVTGNIITSPAVTSFCSSGIPGLITGSTPTGGNGTYTYQWQSSTDNVTFANIAGANAINYSPPSISVTTYYRRAVTSGGCNIPVLSNVITITVLPAVAGNTITSPAVTSFCSSGAPGTIIGSTPTGGNGTYTYQWQSSTDNVTFVNITGANAINYTPPLISVTTYYHRSISSGTCVPPTISNIVTMAINPLPQVTAQGTSICPGISTTLTASSTDQNAVINWYAAASGGNILFTGKTFTTPVLNNSTTYYAEASDNNTGCTSANRAVAAVQIFQQLAAPTVSVQTTTSSSITFQWGVVTGATGYQVSIDNGQTFITPSSGSNGLTHTVSGLQAQQSVTILAHATGSSNCQLSGSSTAVTAVAVNPLGNLIFVPNAFTPNGDGKNDVIYVHSESIKTLKFYVYDQWGELLYTSFAQQNGWDGTYKGTKEPVGVYVYYLEATMIDGQQITKKGTIALLR